MSPEPEPTWPEALRSTRPTVNDRTALGCVLGMTSPASLVKAHREGGECHCWLGAPQAGFRACATS